MAATPGQALSREGCVPPPGLQSTTLPFSDQQKQAHFAVQQAILVHVQNNAPCGIVQTLKRLHLQHRAVSGLYISVKANNNNSIKYKS